MTLHAPLAPMMKCWRTQSSADSITAWVHDGNGHAIFRLQCFVVLLPIFNSFQLPLTYSFMSSGSWVKGMLQVFHLGLNIQHSLISIFSDMTICIWQLTLQICITLKTILVYVYKTIYLGDCNREFILLLRRTWFFFPSTEVQ